jgi:hypothetical protein
MIFCAILEARRYRWVSEIPPLRVECLEAFAYFLDRRHRKKIGARPMPMGQQK